MVFSQKSKGNICDVCSHVNKVDQMRCDKCSHIIGRRSYSGSTRNSSKLSTPRKSNHGANQSDEHEAAKGAENDSSVERTTTGVATLFSTAAGKTVSVSESSLRAARMKLGQELCADGSTLTEPPLQESGPGVATLFSTAAGKTVSVSESSLRAARMKLGQELCADDEATVENTAQSESVGVPPPSTPVAGRRAKVSEPPLRSVGEAFPPNDERLLLSGATPAGVTAVAGPNGQSKNVGACLRQLRKPFVVPFAKVAPDTGKAQEAERSSISNTLRAKRRFNDGVTSTKHISFDVCMYRSMPLSSLPSIDDILNDSFSFKRLGCSLELLQLLEVQPGAEVVLPGSFRKALLSLGASAHWCTEEWCLQMMKSTLIKLRGLSLHCRPALPVFSAEHTLLYMCFKYNHEFVDGQRPALRKVTEGDVPAGSVMVVFFVSLSKDERLSPHTSTGVVSDGFYHVKVSLDVPLTNLLREGKLRRGQKVMMCGAKMLKKDNCTPLECMGEVVLSLSYNCVKPVEPCTALGLYHVCPPVVVPSAIDELGGMVPSLQGVVERVLPPFFIEQPFKRTRDTNARDGGSGGGKVVRNLLAQLKFHDRTSRGGNEEMCEAGKRQLMRVTSFSLTCMHKGDVVLQLWDDFSNGCATEALEEDTCAYPAEGSTIVVFALTPSRFRPSHPFHHAKVLYSRSPLDYRVLSPPDKGGTRLPERAVDSVAAEIVTGGPVDVAGLFVATATVSNFNSHVIAMLQDDWCPGKSSASYCVIDAPLATASKEITLAMPSAPFTPVIVQNASFIKRAEDLGNDCIHTLANEFTRVLTRPATPALRSVVDSLEQLRHTAKTCRVITSRCEELLRLRTLSEEAQSDVRRLACESVGIDVVTTTSSDTSTSRLPYYLREKEAPFKQGVTLPKEKVTVSSSTARESLVNDTPMPLAAAPLRHLFGNVVGFRLIKCHDSGRTERIDLFAVYVAGSSSESVSSDEPPAEDPQRSSHFEIDVQFGATTQQRLTAQINVPRVLHALLEPRITLQRACALAVDEVIPEYSICRAKQLEKWRGAREECWWRFLTRSCVVSARSHDLEAVLEPGDAVEWLASEWDILLEILSSEIRNCLFKFSVENGELTRAVFIREHCNIVNLMRK